MFLALGRQRQKDCKFEDGLGEIKRGGRGIGKEKMREIERKSKLL
jgi:hypothetical protein